MWKNNCWRLDEEREIVHTWNWSELNKIFFLLRETGLLLSCCAGCCCIHFASASCTARVCDLIQILINLSMPYLDGGNALESTRIAILALHMKYFISFAVIREKYQSSYVVSRHWRRRAYIKWVDECGNPAGSLKNWPRMVSFMFEVVIFMFKPLSHFFLWWKCS